MPCHCAECRYAVGHILFIFMMNVIMLSTVMPNVVVPINQSIFNMMSIHSTQTMWCFDSLPNDKAPMGNWLKSQGNRTSHCKPF